LQAEQALRELKRERFSPPIASSVRALWSERAFLVRLSVLGFVVGAAIAFLIPARYTSTTRLMSPDNQSGTSLAASMAASRGVGGFGEIAADVLGLKSNSDVFVSILSSRTVQNQIINKFDLQRTYGARYMEDARRALARRVGIAVDRKSQVITISVTDKDPQRAEGIASAYVDDLNRLVSELSTSAARRERLFLESRLEQVNKDLGVAEREFSQFASKNSAVDIKEQEKAMVDAAATLQGQMMVARSELEGIRQIYTDSNARVRGLKARIAELQSQLEKFGGKEQTSPVGADTDAATFYPSIRKLPLLGVTYADLYRRTRVQESVFEVLTQEYELAKVQEAREIPTVKVLDPADIPEKKSFPPRLLIGISTTLLACLGGIVAVLGSRNWYERDPHDLSKTVATEIWIDLKERRFLNSVNGTSHEPAADSGGTLRPKRSLLSFLGWSNKPHNGNGSHRAYASEENRRDKYTQSPFSGSDGSGSNGSVEERGFRCANLDKTAARVEPKELD